MRLKNPLRKSKQPPVDHQEVIDDNELRMGFFDHLSELQGRFVKILLGLIIGFALGSVFAGSALNFLIEPYANRLVVLGPTGSIVAYFRVALMIAGILSIPLTTYQLLMFIIPGLTTKERRYLFRALPPFTMLFLIGVAFAWFILVPPAINFLESFQPELFRSEWTADRYMSFVTALLFWMGVAFETPLVFFVLSLLGVVFPSMLIKNWRIAIVGTAVAAALITPTVDPVNMFLVMGPLLALYVISIFLVMIGNRIGGHRS